MLQKEAIKEVMVAMCGANVSDGATRFARPFGLAEVWSLDLTAVDDHGGPLDVLKSDVRSQAIANVKGNEPTCAIRPPICTNSPMMIHLNWAKLGLEEMEGRINDARMYPEFCLMIHRIQHRAGRYVLHRHQLYAAHRE